MSFFIKPLNIVKNYDIFKKIFYKTGQKGGLLSSGMENEAEK
jgi:hypothetical protein